MNSSVETSSRTPRPLDASLEPPLEAFGPQQRLAAEALGTTLLLAVVVGSGIMGERLAAGNDAVALLGNTLATGAALVVLITVFGPISGAHFNPVVTAMFAARRELSWRLAFGYMAVQAVAAIAGVWAAHLMFAEPVLQVSTKARDGLPQGFAEAVATFGLVATILGSLRFKPDATPTLVGLYITAAYWFTASTSFANPAVTIARSLTNTFAGISPASAPLFIAGQVVGAVVAVTTFNWLLGRRSTT
ncbi:aquaporin family protein [Phenylobacterium sp. LjRoot225]|uniref:aquaporin n=1 Tax=Phenylobacterium sp. LjRoot225 TaxID=3342285 RepID=UPI003ECCC3C7